jgi:aspartate/methionine/tyrosine aminotransferase
MPTFPASRLADIAPFHVMELMARARALAADGRDIIHMEVGEPDFPTPEPIVAAARASIESGRVFYTPALGLPELRRAIADFYQTRYGLSIPAARIAVTAGASGALLLALACLVEPGSEWLLTDPGYPCNRHFVRSFEGRPVGIPVGPKATFSLHPGRPRSALERTFGGSTAGVSGQPDRHDAEQRATRCHCRLRPPTPGATDRRRDLPRSDLRSCSATALQFGDDIFIVQSFSKYFNMTGWRLGWLVVPERFTRDIEKLAQNLFISPSTPAQHAALAAFTPATIGILETRRQEFQRRRDFLAPALEGLGFHLPAKPDGAFYLYADCSALTGNSESFAHDLLESAGVAVTPGLDFGTHAPEKHLRFAYTGRSGRQNPPLGWTAAPVERLAEAVDRIRRFLGCASH